MRKTKMAVLTSVLAGLLLLAAVLAVPARDHDPGELWRDAPRLSGAGGVVRQRFSGRGRPAGGEAKSLMMKREFGRRKEI